MQQAFFDTYATSYDEHFSNSLIGRAQREAVRRYTFKKVYFFKKDVLEVNCGTGEDALWLAKQGASVLATDVSQGMIEVAMRKSDNESIEFKQIAAQNIEGLAPRRFGAIFSNFGGLNCLSPEELKEFKNGCVKLQGHKDQIVLVIMGRKCLWERFYFGWMKKDKARAKRRSQKDGVEAVIGEKRSMVYYYSPKEIKELFVNEYWYVNTKPIGLFVPPSYLEFYFKRNKTLFHFLIFLDRIFSFSFLSDHADHYIIFFEKK